MLTFTPSAQTFAIPPADAALWDIRLTRTKARELLCDLSLLANPPRVAAQFDPAGEGLTMFLWPQYASDTGLALLLIDYGPARLVSAHGLEARGVWITGRLLWRALRPKEASYAAH